MVKYGVVVVFSAFMIQVVTFGIATSIGVYNIALLEYYGASAATTSLIGSINIGVFLGGGPLASFLMSKTSYRKVALFGAFLSSTGLLCVPFAPSILFINVFYGIFTGLGFCLLYIPSSVLSGLYFESRRSLATGIAQAGYGLGGFLFPFLIHQLIEKYGWKGSLFIVNSINVHTFVFAALLRPIKKQKISLDNVGSEVAYEVKEKQAMINPCQIKQDRRQSVIQSNKLSVLCNMSFITYFINNILWNFGTGIVVVLGPEYFTEIGLDKGDAAMAFTMCGLGALAGSFVGGCVGNIKIVSRISLYSFGNVLLGCFVFLLISVTFHTFIGVCVVNFLWSFAFGIVLGLLVVVTADIVGVPLLSNGMGYIMLANGIGNISGPPLAGLLRDYYGTYYPSICLSGITLIVSGILMLLIPLWKRLRKVDSDRVDDI